MRTLTILTLCLLSSIVFSCKTTTYHFDQDQAVDLKSYKKFAWLQEYDNRSPSLKYQSLTAKRIKTIVESELAAKGLKKVPFEEADFIINIQNKTERKVQIQSSPSFHGSFRYRHFGGGFHDYDVEYYNEHSLFVDFVDPNKKQTIWAAVANDYEMTRESIEATIKHILMNFPEKVKDK